MQKTGLVIPCYNEASRLPGKTFMDFVSRQEAVSFCFVNDGSSDETLTVLKGLTSNNPDRIMVLDMPLNKGKAEAVRQGILFLHERKIFDVIGFWDADLSTPLEELGALLSHLQRNDRCLVAICSRVKRLGADIERKLTRHLFGRIFSTFSSKILRMPVYDSQCGAKVFRKEVVEILFGRKFVTKWLFDVELIARIRNHFGLGESLSLISEIPVSKWKDISGSKIRFSDYISVPVDLLKINTHYNK